MIAHCPWCGYDTDCTREPKTLHHGMCCGESAGGPSCRSTSADRDAFVRIMREDAEDRANFYDWDAS